MTSIELPNIPDQERMPFITSPGYGRTIVRNSVGRFSWSSKKIHAMREPQRLPSTRPGLIDFTADQESDSPARPTSGRYSRRDKENQVDCSTLTKPGPPRWNRRDFDDSKDLLHQWIEYVQETSEEISFCKRRLKTEEEYEKKKTDNSLKQQIENEKNSRAKSPNNELPLRVFPAAQSPFQNCREFLSQLGMHSWERRNTGTRGGHSESKVQLFDKKAIIKEVNDLDERYNRESMKIGFVYIAKGQETRNRILENNDASEDFERFASALGWEMKWSELQGYKPWYNNKSSDSTIHYATPFQEMLFHVATRIKSPDRDPDQSLYKFKFIGNDYVCVIWSEHNRDYHSSIFKSNYLEAMIIIYPIRELGKYRIQCITKTKLQYGPLFDGAIVGRKMLPSLVRATVRNAFRAIQHTQNRENHYDVRVEKIKQIRELQRSSTFEELAMETMSPGLFDSSKYAGWTEVTLDESFKAGTTSRNKKNKNQSDRDRVSQGYNTTDANMSDKSSTREWSKKLKSECSDSDQTGKKASLY